MDHGVVEAVLESGQLALDRIAADVQPRVLALAKPPLDPADRLECATLVTGRYRCSSLEQGIRGLVPRPVHGLVDGSAAVCEPEGGTEVPVVGDDVREVVGAAGL